MEFNLVDSFIPSVKKNAVAKIMTIAGRLMYVPADGSNEPETAVGSDIWKPASKALK